MGSCVEMVGPLDITILSDELLLGLSDVLVLEEIDTLSIVVGCVTSVTMVVMLTIDASVGVTVNPAVVGGAAVAVLGTKKHITIGLN